MVVMKLTMAFILNNQCMRHLFTTPGSAEGIELSSMAVPTTSTAAPPPVKKRKTNPPSKGTVAAKIRMTRVTPRAIAYTCVMVSVLFQLST